MAVLQSDPVHSIIAGRAVPGTAGAMRATDPATGEPTGPVVTLLSAEQVASAVRAAHTAYRAYAATSPVDRAVFLRAAADEIDALGSGLVVRAVAESGLPTARLTGELGRTTGQLRLFATEAEKAAHRGVRVDPALPDRRPLPRPDLRVTQVPLGPVAVFGASNFPLAFSTAGGDTASALAAGCPVVVKAHPAHPVTSVLVAEAVARAAAATGMPPGVFSLVLAEGTAPGQQLVDDPRIKAVGFTGSRAGGLALLRRAQARPEPIPVYAEMSAINPVVVLAGALAADPEALAAAYVGSLTLGSGQFCTNPGLVFLPGGPGGDAFVAAAARQLTRTTGQTMLTAAIAERYAARSAALAELPGVAVVGTGTADGAHAPAPRLVSVDTDVFTATPALAEEVFGAAGVIVRYDSVDDLVPVLAGLEGQLTATLHATEDDDPAALRLLPVLADRAGRVLWGGWPTGVEVTHAMVHGGPWPATSDPRTTSVGSLAVERFQRPVCFQSVPDRLLPPELQDANPWRVPRSVEGGPATEASRSGPVGPQA